MPQKLIRLTCESNDGIFNGKFDEDIHIKQDSEIAFQSLTMERQSSSFNVNSSNDLITFRSRRGAGDQTCRITNKTYEKEDRAELMTDITQKMNSVCDFVTNSAQMNVQWRAKTNELNDLVEIDCRPSPFFPIAAYNPLVALSVFNTFSDREASTEAGVAGAEVPRMGSGGMTRLTQTAAGNLNECYMWVKRPFIKSTGSWRISLAAMTVGTANRPAFTLGLVDEAGKNKLDTATIQLTDLVYAIQVDENSADPAQGGYSYITAKGSAATTPTVPFVKIQNVGLGTQGTNDTLEITIVNNTLQGFIHQVSGKTSLVPSLPLVPGANLYPVIFLHLASTTGPVVTNTIDRIQCSLDPYHEVLDAEWIAYLKDNPQLENKRNDLPTVVDYDQEFQLRTYEPNITLGSLAFAEYLGYTNEVLVKDNFLAPPPESIGGELVNQPAVPLIDPFTDDPYRLLMGYIARARNVFKTAIDSESYLIDTQTFMLDSYDSYGFSLDERNANSGGSRRNLLTTIPVTETAIVNSVNSRITYEPNTLDYIAIKNRSDIITRQIRMRLLNARYDPVITAGMAAITLLIKEPEE